MHADSRMLRDLFTVHDEISPEIRRMIGIIPASADSENEYLDYLARKYARTLRMPDFEDAVVAACAESSGCDYIVTRNISDFNLSPVPAVEPTVFLSKL